MMIAIMFRITKIFEIPSLTIHKIEGKVTDESLQVWIDELSALNSQPDRKVILDFCQVWAISERGVEFLAAHLSNNSHDIHIINPSMDVRNLLHASGLSKRVLE